MQGVERPAGGLHMKEMRVLIIVLLLGIGVTLLWDSVPGIKEGVHAFLDPTLGALLNWNINLGFFAVVLFFTLLTTLLQKYLTDQEMLKHLREEQKAIQAQMKQVREHPEKLLELNQKSIEITMKIMPITMRPVMYTTVPFLLLLRWFGDYFADVSVKIFGLFNSSGSFLFPNWVWAYLLASIVLSIFLRKWLKVH